MQRGGKLKSVTNNRVVNNASDSTHSMSSSASAGTDINSKKRELLSACLQPAEKIVEQTRQMKEV